MQQGYFLSHLRKYKDVYYRNELVLFNVEIILFNLFPVLYILHKQLLSA